MTAKPDARAATWRVRIRLYDAAKPDDPLADTDPERPGDAVGEAVEHGLPAVAALLAALATTYHGAACDGLDYATLHHKLAGLRPTLSRRKGNAIWRLGYRVNGRDYRARVNIVRESAPTRRAET